MFRRFPMPQSLRLPDKWPLRALFLSACGIYLGTWLGYYLFSRGLDPAPGPISQALINWDAKWYIDIASQGYSYVPHAPFGQNIIFFPLYPAMIKVLSLILPFSMPALGIGLAIFCGILSIFLFRQLADHWLAPQGAAFATFSYALYPAAAFFISAYPTALMNCLALATLLALSKRRQLEAALWAGMGTAAGPLMVFFSLGIWFIIARQNWVEWEASQRLQSALKSIGLGFVACSGLFVFMIYQWWQFKTPLAFVIAHGPYIGSLSPVQKILHILELYPLWGGDYLPLLHSLTLQPTALNPARSVYFLMNAITLLCAVYVLRILWRERQWAFMVSSLSVLLAYLWFQGAAQGPVSTYRLLYVDIPLFLAAGWAYQSHEKSLWPRWLLGAEWTALMLQAALFISGHWAF